MDTKIKPADRLKGEAKLPGDKSVSHRVVLIGGISKGKTIGKNFLEADDCIRTVSAFRDMGVDIRLEKKNIAVSGRGLKGLKNPDKDLYLGNSGTTMRLLPGILAGQNFKVRLTGDDSLANRPMARIVEPLRMMGVSIEAERENFPPLVIEGGSVRPIMYSTKVASAQVKSCVLLAGLYAKGVTKVTEPFLSRDHTERMLEFFGAKISRDSLTVSVEGVRELSAREIVIPGDISGAAFFIAAACLLEGSDITVREVGLNPTRLGFINVLKRMGASISIENRKQAVEPYGDIRVRYAPLKSATVSKEEMPLLIDEIPVLSVLASCADGETVINGIAELRVKETDRVSSMAANLRKMGRDVRIVGESLVIKGSKKRFKKAALESYKDHRTAMSMAIAGLYAESECVIRDTECVNTSFPGFFETLDYLK